MAEVETTREGAVLTITLNRPDVLNAFNADLHKGLAAALELARTDEVRAVVVTGAGRGFCVGQDLTEFREAPGDIGSRLRATYHPNVLAVRTLEKPVIAAVNGAAAGAGLSFACACDVRIAADSASFVPAFINIGLVPDMGGTFFVRRLLGSRDSVIGIFNQCLQGLFHVLHQLFHFVHVLGQFVDLLGEILQFAVNLAPTLFLFHHFLLLASGPPAGLGPPR